MFYFYRTYTNISQDTKNKENIPQSLPNLNTNLTRCFPSTTREQTSIKSPSTCNVPALIIKSAESHMLLNITNTDHKKSEPSTSKTISTPKTCASQHFDVKKQTSQELTNTSAMQSDTCYVETTKKRMRPKSESDDIEQSFLSLTETIKEKLQNSKAESVANQNVNDVDDKFSELVAAELRKLTEIERKEKKKKLLMFCGHKTIISNNEITKQ